MTPISGATLVPVAPTGSATSTSGAGGASGAAPSGFVGTLSGVLGQAAQAAQLADGTGDIAKTMLSIQEATLAVGLLAQVRDRVVSAYQALMSESV